MDTDRRGRLRRLGERLFPERQIFFRSHGQVRFFRFSRGSQVALLTVLVSAVGWATFASVKFVKTDRTISAMERQIAGLAEGYRALGDDLQTAQNRVVTLSSGIEAKQRELEARQREIDAKYRQRAVLVGEKAALEETLDTLSRDLDTAVRERADLIEQRADLIEQKAVLDGAFEALTGELRTATLERDTARTKASMIGERVTALESALRGTTRTRDRLTSRVETLEGRLARIEPAQNELVARLREYTEASTGDLEAMIALTGLDVDALLEGTGQARRGRGGPFIDVGDLGERAEKFRGLGDDLHSSVLALEFNLNRWNGLQGVLKRLPLAAPVDSFYVSSKFGKRTDPFTKRKAMHYGVDLAGALKSSVWSTAPGVVVRVGRGGSYGGSVEIDHGLGITTRYSHLHKILVEKGQVVPFRHKIGLMGSTGRSTGSHVHYEVIFKGVPRNPAKFMKAGKYVFKT